MSLEGISSYFQPLSLDGLDSFTQSVQDNALLVDGSNQMLADLNMGQHNIKRVADALTTDEAVNLGQLQAEASRAQAAEQQLSADLQAETSRAQAAEQQLATDLTAEVTRATAAEQQLSTDLQAETSRAQDAEQFIAQGLVTEYFRATDAEQLLAANLAAETSRAQGAEQQLATDLAALDASVANCVTLDTTQTVTGAKTFSQQVVMSGGASLSNQLTVQYPNAIAEVRCTNENQDAAVYLTTPYQNGAGRRKTMIVADGLSTWNRADLHFCLNSAATHDSVTLADSRLVVKNGGNVGVGTTTPSTKLDVNGAATVRGDVDVTGNRVRNLADGELTSDAATFSQLQTEVTRATAAEAALAAAVQVERDARILQDQLLSVSIAAETSRAQTAEATLLPLAGGTVSGETTFNAGVILDGGTSSFQGTTQVDESNRTNTYITFKQAGSGNDWAYLRQIGGTNAQHIALQFHDDANDGRFSIGRIGSSSSSPDPPRSQLFELDGNSARFFVPLVVQGSIDTSNWISGQTMMTYVNQIETGKYVVVNGQTYNNVTIQGLEITRNNDFLADNYLEVELQYTVKSSTDRVMVNLASTYYFGGSDSDTVRLQVYETSASGAYSQTPLYTAFHQWNSSGGGGSRSTPLFPCFFVYTTGDANNFTRKLMLRVANLSGDDTLTMKHPIFVHITQVKN